MAVLSAPAAFIWLWKSKDMALGWAIVATAVAVFAFRGLLDLIFRRFIPQPSLFALERRACAPRTSSTAGATGSGASGTGSRSSSSALITIVFLVRGSSAAT